MTVTNQTVANVTPANQIARKGNRNIVETQKWTMARIDALPGGRGNFIRVMVDNPKQAGSIASRNFGLYGKLDTPSVTVAEFVKSYPSKDGGVTRAERSLTWDLDRGIVKLSILIEGLAERIAPALDFTPEQGS